MPKMLVVILRSCGHLNWLLVREPGVGPGLDHGPGPDQVPGPSLGPEPGPGPCPQHDMDTDRVSQTVTG